jgi:GGDEF domain-containing protein
MRAAERLRDAIAQAVVDYACNSVNVTASFGISVLGATEDDAAGLRQRAEEALREAKRNGRNRTAILAPADAQLDAPQRARIAVRR